MHLRSLFLALSAGGTLVSACGGYAAQAPADTTSATVARLVQEALKAPAPPAGAVAEIRKLGPAGLDAAFDVLRPALALPSLQVEPLPTSLRTSRPLVERPTPAADHLIDAIAGQRDARFARLFWHTDLAEARVRAVAEHKPILSLRLLGRLDEEMSCANSRFFRTALYPDPRIGEILRRDYVLHWETVCDVPKITIDFGGGRTLQRTITGNSIHYVLDEQGRVLDALPGLYAPAVFAQELTRIQQLHHDLQSMTDESARRQALVAYHQKAAAAAEDVLRANGMPDANDDGKLPGNTDWTGLAKIYAVDAQLSENSAELIRAKNARRAMRSAMSKAMVEEPILSMVQTFERTLAEDTARNELDFRRQFHQWMADGNAATDVAALNAQVYANIFMMPLTDPWLGLQPNKVYTGIDEGQGVPLALAKR